MENEEIKYINYQLIGLGITLITTVIAIIITYNQKLGAAKKEKILSNKNSLSLTYFNRILILLIAILFLYINYRFYEIDKEKGVDIKGDILQITASILTIVGALIAIYVVTLSNAENIADIENPNI